MQPSKPQTIPENSGSLPPHHPEAAAAGVEASAPGKVILAGDHAVVHGKPAILAAINLRCRARLVPRDDDLIEIFSDQVEERVETTLDAILQKTIRAREQWEEFRRTNSKAHLRQITPRDLDLVEIGIGETILATGAAPTSGFSLRIESDLPVGEGLGSSATVIAAVVKVLDKRLQTRMSTSLLSNIVYNTEKKKHGASSGVDVAAAVYGGVLWYRRETDFLRVVTPLSVDHSEKLFDKITLILTGRPEASTGEAVRHVMERAQRAPQETRAIFDEIEQQTKEIAAALRANDQARLKDGINRCGDQLEKLGVVPPAAKAIIDQVRGAGGAAKTTGAGSLGGERVGTILALHEDTALLQETLRGLNLRFQTVHVAEHGAV